MHATHASFISCHIKLSHRNPLEIPWCLLLIPSVLSLIGLFFPVPLPSPLSLQFPMVSHSTLKVTWVPGAVDVPAHRIVYSTNHGSDVKQVSRSQKSLVRFLMYYPNCFVFFSHVLVILVIQLITLLFKGLGQWSAKQSACRPMPKLARQQ